jgi:hypothetical protein
VLSDIIGQSNKEMPFSVDEFWNDDYHIDISIIAVSFKSIAPENFKPVSKLLEVEIGMFGQICDIIHPLIDNIC